MLSVKTLVVSVAIVLATVAILRVERIRFERFMESIGFCKSSDGWVECM